MAPAAPKPGAPDDPEVGPRVARGARPLDPAAQQDGALVGHAQGPVNELLDDLRAMAT